MGRRRRIHKRRHDVTLFMIAFGAGLFLALTCSLKLVLLIAACALIYLGITFRC